MTCSEKKGAARYTRRYVKKGLLAFGVFSFAVIGTAILLATVADPDSSLRPASKKVLNRDDQGRVIVETDERGWKVQYIRDDQGNVIEKRWIDPNNPMNEWVRMYEFEKGRLIREMDIHGRAKLLTYPEDGSDVLVNRPDDFIEETGQHRFFGAAPVKKAGDVLKITTFKYDEGGRITQPVGK